MSDNIDVQEVKDQNVLKELLLSVIVIACVAISWTAATQFSQTALTIDPSHFNAPYFSMWFGTNFMVLCYPVYIIYELVRRRQLSVVHREAETLFGNNGVALYKVVPFNILWIGANYTYSRALMCVAASVAASISASNPAMVYILAILFLGAKLFISKSLSVLCAVAGVVVLSLKIPGGGNGSQVLGVILSVVSAFSAACYKVAFKRFNGDATLGHVSLFMSCLGFLNLTLNAFPTFVLLITGTEHIDWSYIPWGPMCGSAVLGLVFNFSINFGIALLNPLVVSIGMLTGIPLNTVFDILFNGVEISLEFIIGTVLISISFCLIILPLDNLRWNRIRICREELTPLKEQLSKL